jgi:hypothetical protein
MSRVLLDFLGVCRWEMWKARQQDTELMKVFGDCEIDDEIIDDEIDEVIAAPPPPRSAAALFAALAPESIDALTNASGVGNFVAPTTGLRLTSNVGVVDVAPSQPKKQWSLTTTEIWDVKPKALPTECVPNAQKSLDQRISLKDPFGLIDFTRNLNSGQYKTHAALLDDLVRLCFKLNTGCDWMIKRPAVFTGNLLLPNVYQPISESDLMREISALPNSAVRTVIQKNRGMFMAEGLTFNSSIPGYKNVFEGWCYNALPNPDYSVIALYLEHIRKLTFFCNPTGAKTLIVSGAVMSLLCAVMSVLCNNVVNALHVNAT